MKNRWMTAALMLALIMGCAHHNPTGVNSTQNNVRWTVWGHTQQNPVNAIFFLDTIEGWDAGLGICHTLDGGRTWQTQYIDTGYSIRDYFAMYFTDRLHGWAAGRRGLIVHTIDGGRTWNEQSWDKDLWFNAVYFVNNNIGWVVSGDSSWTGPGYKLFYTSDGGRHWVLNSSSTIGQVRSIYFANENEGWAVGGYYGYDMVLHTRDGGITWEQQNTSYSNAVYEWLQKVQFVDNQVGYIVGLSGTVMKTSNHGATWAYVCIISQDVTVRDAFFIGEKRGWICGYNYRLGRGFIMSTIDGGNTWHDEDIADSLRYQDVTRLWFYDENHGLAADNNIHILKRNNE